MSQPVRCRWGAVTITGNYRENNEDNLHVDPEGRYFLVADGMGGQSAGEKASELAIELVADRLSNCLTDLANDNDVVAAIDEAVAHANAEIMALGELDPKYRNMGTTITFVINPGGRLFVGGVGDSRVYRLRDGALDQLTKDHSLTQALLDAGTITAEEAANHRYKNVLYRYLGTKEGGQGTDAQVVAAAASDRFLLCSDGVTDGIDDDEITRLLQSESDPQKAAETLVDAALNGGSRDNITCIVVDVESA
ncbi:Serine/threonine phosphatase stp [Maioricimonas rarisocia]|uniref:Serine/threonine phosphatase stp n=1 Tax=Maioricimonas rarisocia TaxID=2528026 RepID=A0A517ZCA9_9PLAN|nr:protein phosphatase 2C domain-containing protein [Maioricimonas rarisocia]QDU40092.1 Serine/threonine phosphatase stp [Maioricimonas rarisocia]